MTMMKRMKKAIGLFMAACLLAGSGYTGEASTSVSVTPIQETSENINTNSVSLQISDTLFVQKMCDNMSDLWLTKS